MKQGCKERSHERSGVFGTFLFFFLCVCVCFFSRSRSVNTSHLTFIPRSAGHTLYSSSVTRDTVCFRSVFQPYKTLLSGERTQLRGTAVCPSYLTDSYLKRQSICKSCQCVTRQVTQCVGWYLWETPNMGINTTEIWSQVRHGHNKSRWAHRFVWATLTKRLDLWKKKLFLGSNLRRVKMLKSTRWALTLETCKQLWLSVSTCERQPCANVCSVVVISQTSSRVLT